MNMEKMLMLFSRGHKRRRDMNMEKMLIFLLNILNNNVVMKFHSSWVGLGKYVSTIIKLLILMDILPTLSTRNDDLKLAF